MSFTHHLHLDETGYAEWEPRHDTQIEGIACLNEHPEGMLEVCVLGASPVAAQFSPLHLSLLWPQVMNLAWSITVTHRETVQVRGPKGAIVVFAGRWA
jgi:hypothetical protein